MEDQVEFWIAVVSILFGAGSEIIGISKWKPNSWVQLIIKIVGKILSRAARKPKDLKHETKELSREGR